MILYYAFGGGLGHLTRANALMYTFGYLPEKLYILTSSNFANLIFQEKNIIKLPDELYLNPKELGAKIESIIIEYKIDIFFIDSFPSGINGELNNFKISNCEIRYIARLLNWENYLPYICDFNISFDSTFIIEKLDDSQLSFILNNSKRHQYIDLKYHPSKNLEKVKQILPKTELPIWLIVHSGNQDEMNQLCSYAYDLAEYEKLNPAYLIISQTDDKTEFSSGLFLKYYPASDFFPFVDKIFTACGFNSMNQTKQYAYKHHFIPFKRRFDDQYTRAKNRKHFIDC